MLNTGLITMQYKILKKCLHDNISSSVTYDYKYFISDLINIGT